MGVKLLMSMAFHPQMDGAMEWVSCSIGQILQTIIQVDQKNWADKFPMVELVLNSNISTMTGLTPFEITWGYMPHIGFPFAIDTKFKGVKQFSQQAQWNLMAAHDAIIKRCIVQTFHANRKHCADSSDADRNLYKDDSPPVSHSAILYHHLIAQPALIHCHSTIRFIYTFQ